VTAQNSGTIPESELHRKNAIDNYHKLLTVLSKLKTFLFQRAFNTDWLYLGFIYFPVLSAPIYIIV